MDDIRSLLFGVVFVIVLISLPLIVICAIENTSPIGDGVERVNKVTKYAVPIAVLIVFVCGTLRTLLPSTKQLAVIKIGPKVVSAENMEFVSDESKELYVLFKAWLKDQVKDRSAE